MCCFKSYAKNGSEISSWFPSEIISRYFSRSLSKEKFDRFSQLVLHGFIKGSSRDPFRNLSTDSSGKSITDYTIFFSKDFFQRFLWSYSSNSFENSTTDFSIQSRRDSFRNSSKFFVGSFSRISLRKVSRNSMRNIFKDTFRIHKQKSTDLEKNATRIYFKILQGLIY